MIKGALQSTHDYIISVLHEATHVDTIIRHAKLHECPTYPGTSTVDDGDTTNSGSDDSEDDDTAGAAGLENAAWLDAAWQVTVTVVGAMVIAAGAACGSSLCMVTKPCKPPADRG